MCNSHFSSQVTSDEVESQNLQARDLYYIKLDNLKKN